METTKKDLALGGWMYIQDHGNLQIWGKNKTKRLLYNPETGKIVDQYEEKEEE